MKQARADWPALHNPLLTLAAVLLASAATVAFTQRALSLEKSRHARQEVELRAARERLQASGDEKERRLRYGASFAALQQQGFVGEEHRIDWVDALHAASRKLKLSGVNYQIEAQQPYQSPIAEDTAEYRVRQSLMKISLGLLHEEDLMRFLQMLSEQHAGIFAIRACSLQRQSIGSVENAGTQANLQADCELAWLSVGGAPGK